MTRDRPSRLFPAAFFSHYPGRANFPFACGRQASSKHPDLSLAARSRDNFQFKCRDNLALPKRNLSLTKNISTKPRRFYNSDDRKLISNSSGVHFSQPRNSFTVTYSQQLGAWWLKICTFSNKSNEILYNRCWVCVIATINLHESV